MKQNKFDIMCEYLLETKDELRLKYLFDNIRNYGIVGLLVLVGMKLSNAEEILFPFLKEVSVIMIFIYAFFLGILNLIQPLLLIKKNFADKVSENKFKKIFYTVSIYFTFIMSIVLLFGIIQSNGLNILIK